MRDQTSQQRPLWSLLLGSLAFAACSATPDHDKTAETNVARNIEIWPQTQSPIGLDPVIEKRIDTLLAQMTIRQKVGQVIQGDIGSITPDDLLTYPLGSILNGGNSAPNADNRSPALDWLTLADAFYDATLAADRDGGPFIPLLWGTDAVHGHNNIPGATIFPHNIGLGAARNPNLLRQIGDITAREIRVTGQEWTFAPTVAVVRDDRWGRTYEGYSENPLITASYARPLIEGIQGQASDADFLTGPNVIATAKHFIGDGGTVNGVDQGRNIDSEADLYRIHGAAYPPAIEAGVQVVMASYNSWSDQKLHGHEYLLTNVLKGRLGFDGFVVGDWNGHGQIEGCTNTDCPAALHAGLDMYMAPDSWRRLFDTTLAQAEAGDIDLVRLDDAVRRILRVKLRSGLFEAERPSARKHAGDLSVLGSPPSKAVARQAVRESLVLLKNEGVLPIRQGARILVTGDGADNIGKQSGGWTFSWQGTGNTNEDFINGTSFLDRIRTLSQESDGRVITDLDATLSGSETADVAIVVFGEDPYAEFIGDREDLAYKSENDADLTMMRQIQDAGIPVVAVFLSGRPMWVNREMNLSDAFVAAWLPGSEGGYAADLLFAQADGRPKYDFTGQLPYSWPRTAVQTPLNIGDPDYDPLFAYGYGLSYEEPGTVGELPEDAGIALDEVQSDVFLRAGEPLAPWTLATAGAVLTRKVDGTAQEDTLDITFQGDSSVQINGPVVDLSRRANGDMALSLTIRVPSGGVVPDATIGLLCTDRDCGHSLVLAGALIASDQFTTIDIGLTCFAPADALTDVTSPVHISATQGQLQIIAAELVANEGQASCLDAGGRN